MMKKINVAIYGIDPKRKNRAEIISCDKCDKCDFYKNRTCLNVTSMFCDYCKFGKLQRIEGYTQKAMKYHKFNDKYKSDELYNALDRPADWHIRVIDDIAVINLTYANLKKDERENWRIDSMCFTIRNAYVPLSELTTELMYKICTSKVRAFMGGGFVSDYQNEVIPNFLDDLKHFLPEKYNVLISEHPKLKEIEPNYVGRYAYVYSLREGIEISDIYKHGKFIKKGNYLICDKYNMTFAPFDSKSVELKIKITKDMVYEIKSNDEVDENTVFK